MGDQPRYIAKKNLSGEIESMKRSITQRTIDVHPWGMEDYVNPTGINVFTIGRARAQSH